MDPARVRVCSSHWSEGHASFPVRGVGLVYEQDRNSNLDLAIALPLRRLGLLRAEPSRCSQGAGAAEVNKPEAASRQASGLEQPSGSG